MVSAIILKDLADEQNSLTLNQPVTLKWLTRFSAMFCLVLLTACTLPSGPTQISSSSEAQSGPNTATRSLLKEAALATELHQYGQANELIERAIRLSPRSAYAYEALAQLRYKEARYQEASALVKKAIQLARNIPAAADKKALVAKLNSLTKRLENH